MNNEAQQAQEAQDELDYQELIAQVALIDKDAAEYMKTKMRECFCFSPSGKLSQVVIWENTEQGSMYWYDIACKIEQ
jgi:hypothetical protein